jgi:hypothetical protein
VCQWAGTAMPLVLGCAPRLRERLRSGLIPEILESRIHGVLL